MTSLRIVQDPVIPPFVETTQEYPKDSGEEFYEVSRETLTSFFRAMDSTSSKAVKAQSLWSLPKDPVLSALTRASTGVYPQKDDPISRPAGLVAMSLALILHQVLPAEDKRVMTFGNALSLGDSDFTVRIGDHLGLVLVDSKPVAVVLSLTATAAATAGKNAFTEKDQSLNRQIDQFYSNYRLEPTTMPCIHRIVAEDKNPLDLLSAELEALVARIRQRTDQLQ